MRIFINAGLSLGGGAGGAEQFVEGLVRGLAQIDSGHEFILGIIPGAEDWLGPLAGESMTFAQFPSAERERQVSQLESRIRRRLAPYKRRLARFVGRHHTNERALGQWIDSQRVNVCHFPYQVWGPTRTPAILNLHDLQHLHYPQFFTPEVLASRKSWAAWGQDVDILVAGTEWTRLDYIKRLGVHPEKVKVVNMASPLEGVELADDYFLSSTVKQFDVPEVFAFYPAATWPHKNHVALVKALDALRDSNLFVVCTGTKTSNWSAEIEPTIKDLALGDRFRYLDFVSPRQLKALYQLATFVIVPSLFEGGGSFVAFEAISEGVPLACSSIATLSEVVGDAGLFFDGGSVHSIAEAMRRLLNEPHLRRNLREATRMRARQYSWRLTALAYLRLYEELAGT